MTKGSKPQLRKVLSLLAGKYQRTRVRKEIPALEQGMLFLLAKDIRPEVARSALERMRRELVDWNELRVSGIPEIARMMTPLRKDPSMISKVQRLREYINQVFNLRHTLNLEPLREEGREKQEKFLTALECLDPYMIETFLGNLSEEGTPPFSSAVARVLQRIGLISKTSSVAKQRADIEDLAPSKDLQNFYALLSRHAEEICGPRSPLCGQCMLLSLCKFGKTHVPSPA